MANSHDSDKPSAEWMAQQEPVGELVDVGDDTHTLICEWTELRYQLPAGTKFYAAPVAKPAAQDRLARYGIHSDGQPLTPYGVQLIDDLAGLVRRLRYHLKKNDPSNQLVAQADEYLRRYDLQGNPLRDDEEPK